MAVMRTVRGRVTAMAALVATVMLVAVAIAVVAVLRVQLSEGLDDNLRQRADALAALVSSGATTLPAAEDMRAQLVAPDGSTLSGGGLAGLVAAPASGAVSSSPTFHSVTEATGERRHLRVLVQRVEMSSGPATLLLGTDLGDVDEPASIMTRALAVAVPIVVGLLTLSTWWLTGRTLRPVGAIRRQLAAITVTDLGRRVPEPGTGDEIDQLARTTNATLDRLEDSVGRQQRFVADASHELRGPLTRMRSALEVDLSHPSSATPWQTHRAVLDETIGLQHLVDDLLHLARSDAGAASAGRDIVDLDDVVLREASEVRAAHGELAIETRHVHAVRVAGSREQLARAVRNVADNAARHATSAVVFDLREVDGRARLTVADDGAGIAVADTARVFERFARLDEARSASNGGTGLGLAITKEIVERHGGSVAVAASDGGQAVHGTRIVIDLPMLAEPGETPSKLGTDAREL